MPRTIKIDTSKKPTENIPPTEEIVEEAITEVKKSLIKRYGNNYKNAVSPSQFARRVEKKALEIYNFYVEKIREEYKKIGHDMEKLGQSIQQSRFSRGGRTFEIIFEKILEDFGVKYERGKLIKIYEDMKRQGEKPDFIIPSRDDFLSNPSNAILITAKREVRERWREAIGEAQILRSKFGDDILLWFVGFDKKVSLYSAVSMLEHGIDRVYVIDERHDELIKELKRSNLPKRKKSKYLCNIRKFSDIFDDIQELL